MSGDSNNVGKEHTFLKWIQGTWPFPRKNFKKIEALNSYQTSLGTLVQVSLIFALSIFREGALAFSNEL